MKWEFIKVPEDQEEELMEDYDVNVLYESDDIKTPKQKATVYDYV